MAAVTIANRIMKEAAPDFPGPFSFVLSAKPNATTKFLKHK
jgi:hypothetical protein